MKNAIVPMNNAVVPKKETNRSQLNLLKFLKIDNRSDAYLGSYDGLDYFSNPIATSPSAEAKFKDITRLIDCFGRSTLVAQFKEPPMHDPHRTILYGYYGTKGLQTSENPDAKRALEALRQAESVVRANPDALGTFPSASGSEANPEICGNKGSPVKKLQDMKKLPELTS